MDKPYVGVTGAVSEAEVMAIVDAFEKNGLTMQSPHMPMNGTLVSYKTLDLGNNPGNRRYPEMKEIPGILAATKNKTFNTIHFNTKRPEVLSSDIKTVMEFGGIYKNGLCQGVQYNVAWPPIDEIDKIRSEYPDLKMILQLSSKATEGMSQKEIVEKAAEYADTDYVLIDPSCGKGLGFDIEYSVNLYRKLKEGGIKATVGFAGGLSGENVAGVIGDLIARMKTDEFVIDAEGNLRDKITPAYGDDVMNIEKVRKYISAAANGFRSS
jgi:phosphoribosylanthranilate isomerase